MGHDLTADDERPAWARRIQAERAARGWSQADAVRALQAHAGGPLPANGSLLRNWRRWEAGETEPDEFYKPLIAKTFGTVTGAFFPRPSHRDADTELLTGTGMDTLELLSRLRMSDVSSATLDALRITADRLCCEYPYMAADQLRVEGQEAGNADIVGWALEMRAWYALTQGDYRGVIATAAAGDAQAAGRPVAVQLAGQRAKAWARIGDRAQVELALEHGRSLLESLPYPDDLDNHFHVDPTKFDFYAMDCYRLLGEDRRAEIYAREILRYSANPDGTERAPMRSAEARITLGVAAARAGNLDLALSYGRQALTDERKSLPSLLNVSRELKNLLQQRYPKAKETATYLDELRALTP